MNPDLELFLRAAESLARARAAGTVTQAQVAVAVAGAAMSLGVDAISFILRTAELQQDRLRAIARGECRDGL